MPANARLLLIAAFLVLWLGTSGALVVYGKGLDHNAKGLGRQESVGRLSQIANCHRGNERTVSDNLARLDDWRFDTSITKLLKRGLARPRIVLPGVNQLRSDEERAEATDLLRSAEAAEKDKRWHHLIEDCEYAVDHPNVYKLPPAVFFSHERPPAGALRVEAHE